MAEDKSSSTATDEFSPIGFAAFLVVVALFVFLSTSAGTRGMGICMIAGAVVQQFQGRIAYGWEDRPPAGYLTGALATVLNLIFLLLGLAIVIWPEVAMGIVGWSEK